MEPEEILLERKSRGKKEYFIRWKGQGSESDSWESASSVPQKLVRKYNSSKTPAKKSRSRSASRGRGRSRSKSTGRKTSKSPSRRRSAPGGAVTRVSRRSVIETKPEEDEVKTEVITKTQTTSQNDIGGYTKTVKEEKVVTLKKSSTPAQKKQQEPAWKPAFLPDFSKYYNSDYAVIIVFTCVVIITLSFVLENKVDWAMIWNYIMKLFNSIQAMVTGLFSSSSSSSSKPTSAPKTN